MVVQCKVFDAENGLNRDWWMNQETNPLPAPYIYTNSGGGSRHEKGREPITFAKAIDSHMIVCWLIVVHVLSGEIQT